MQASGPESSFWIINVRFLVFPKPNPQILSPMILTFLRKDILLSTMRSWKILDHAMFHSQCLADINCQLLLNPSKKNKKKKTTITRKWGKAGSKVEQKRERERSRKKRKSAHYNNVAHSVMQIIQQALFKRVQLPPSNKETSWRHSHVSITSALDLRQAAGPAAVADMPPWRRAQRALEKNWAQKTDIERFLPLEVSVDVERLRSNPTIVEWGLRCVCVCALTWWWWQWKWQWAGDILLNWQEIVYRLAWGHAEVESHYAQCCSAARSIYVSPPSSLLLLLLLFAMYQHHSLVLMISTIIFISFIMIFM